ncbi:signal transduction histidine kinase [Kitasatospora sp. MAA4]|uniref:sensor histidine kinase n=1 Tax=Kitasatospora sp. MAA4 TaxID=3035093 RepID=UPI00247603CA|nr:sensor histidine kinase [Kitasatospora sp. MAA4]MDH6130886.1 signal transduction histidine kinase [Kitasatospora sp. MAA4]
MSRTETPTPEGTDDAVGHSANTPALRLMNLALHGLFFTLLVVLVVRGLLDGALGAAGLVIAGALAAVYAAGGLAERIRTDRLWAGLWLGAVVALWAGLTLLHPEFCYLVFPLYFVCLHLMPVRWAVPSVVALTGVVVAAQAGTPGGLTTPKVLGPLAGLAVALLTAYGYAALYRESRERQRLIDDLMRTRDALAASQREAGRLAERQRLAREIHDTLAQGLSSIVLLARSADAALPADPATAASRIREVGQTASENLAEARRFVQALTPPALDDVTLTEALRRLAAGPGAAFQLDGEPYPLPVEAEVALLRLTQEALANAVRHARARQIAVTLTYLDDEVTLDVFDDGVGFDPQTVQTVPSGARPTFGLHGMHERIAALGGSLTVESAPGEGTAVAASLPLRSVVTAESVLTVGVCGSAAVAR